MMSAQSGTGEYLEQVPSASLIVCARQASTPMVVLSESGMYRFTDQDAPMVANRASAQTMPTASWRIAWRGTFRAAPGAETADRVRSAKPVLRWTAIIRPTTARIIRQYMMIQVVRG